MTHYYTHEIRFLLAMCCANYRAGLLTRQLLLDYIAACVGAGYMTWRDAMMSEDLGYLIVRSI
jgi:hypothetical protein